MIAKNVKVIFVKMTKKEGVSKAGKPYAFFDIKLADDEYNVFNVGLSRELSSSEKVVNELSALKNKECEVDLQFVQKGFAIAGELVAIDTL